MYEFLKTKGKLKSLIRVWGGLARAKRSGCSPRCCPRHGRRGAGRAGAALCPLRSPAGTAPRLSSHSTLGFGRELLHFILLRSGLFSCLFVSWEVGLPLDLSSFFCRHRLQPKASKSSQARWSRAGAGEGRALNCPPIAGLGGKAQPVLWTDPQIFWLERRE